MTVSGSTRRKSHANEQFVPDYLTSYRNLLGRLA